MKNLKFKFDLNSRFAVYVPSTLNVDEKHNNSQEVDYVMKRMSLLFGGATSTPAKGGWMSEKGNLIIEDVTIVYSYCTTEQAIENFNAVISICNKLKKEMKQEAITLEYNNQIKFI